ncbi:hypothetical protein GF325_07105, partial [Candidatus Bathyarchaeota archaeon]|nr:hypothetical protein [Candidatus Bathyarchaeota archaeon]
MIKKGQSCNYTIIDGCESRQFPGYHEFKIVISHDIEVELPRISMVKVFDSRILIHGIMAVRLEGIITFGLIDSKILRQARILVPKDHLEESILEPIQVINPWTNEELLNINLLNPPSKIITEMGHGMKNADIAGDAIQVQVTARQIIPSFKRIYEYFGNPTVASRFYPEKLHEVFAVLHVSVMNGTREVEGLTIHWEILDENDNPIARRMEHLKNIMPGTRKHSCVPYFSLRAFTILEPIMGMLKMKISKKGCVIQRFEGEIEVASINTMAWYPSAITKLVPKHDLETLDDLQLLKFITCWIPTRNRLLSTRVLQQFTSMELGAIYNVFREAETAFKNFLSMVENDMQSRPIGANRLILSFLKTLHEWKVMDSNQLSHGNHASGFRLSEEAFIEGIINETQHIRHPEFTILEGTGNCINLSILFCTFISFLGRANEISPGIAIAWINPGKAGSILHAMPGITRDGKTRIFNIANPRLWEEWSDDDAYIELLEQDASKILELAGENEV